MLLLGLFVYAYPRYTHLYSAHLIYVTNYAYSPFKHYLSNTTASDINLTAPLVEWREDIISPVLPSTFSYKIYVYLSFGKHLYNGGIFFLIINIPLGPGGGANDFFSLGNEFEKLIIFTQNLIFST